MKKDHSLGPRKPAGAPLAALGALVCVAAAARAVECPTAERQAAARDYGEGVAAYRAGNVDASYPLLQAANALCPDDPHYRNDFVVAAVGAGHAAEALALGAPLDAGALPTYVLEALGRAARDTHQPDLAIHYYDAILAAGRDIGAAVGRDLALIDRGNAREAQTDLQALSARFTDRVDVLEALGLADEALGEVIPALAAAESLLRLDPAYPGGLALRYRMLVSSGAPQLAAEVTPQRLVSPAQRGAALHDALALEFRWARDAPGSDKLRARNIDAVIAHMRAAIADPAIGADARADLRRDLVEALAERGRAAEAIVEYESLIAEGLAIPPYVTAAAVGAYLARRRPERAAALFRSLPADSHPAFGVQVNYFYALLESGHYAAAVAWADRLTRQEGRYHDADSPDLRSENDDYAGALVLAALARTYTDRLAEAQRRLTAILNTAPADADARLALAETEALRGWPRRGAATAMSVLQFRPDASGPWSKSFYDELQIGAGAAAYEALGSMTADLPADDAALLRAERDWQTHDTAEISIDGQIGRSYGGRPGVIDSTVEEYGYSPPIASDYRVYVHLNQGEGTPAQGDTYRHAVGAGVEYHTADWLATAELLEIDRAGPSPQFSLEATPNDYWKFGGSYSLRTLDVPIAAGSVGVQADRAALNLDYRASDLRVTGAILQHEEFSDGNSRFEALWFWRERWISGPVYKLDTRLDLDTSTNSLGANVNYFNPKHDFTGSVTLQNQWLQFRRYDCALTHQLEIGAGDYVQQGYDAGLVAFARYQLSYEVNDRIILKAGVGRTIRPYDGDRERLDAVTFGFLGRIW